MLLTVALAASMISQSSVPDLQGSRLNPGESCFAMLHNDQVIGSTWQRVEATKNNGKAAWDIVVHQIMGKNFDMRDHFILDRNTLLPLEFDSVRDPTKQTPLWHQVALHYTAHRITGTKISKNGTQSIDVALPGPTWDGNLWGLTFAALPLTAGASFRVPTWQYDQGFGSLLVHVIGKGTAHVDDKSTPVWEVDASADPTHLLRYHISVNPPDEISYESGPFSQKLGGTCPQR